MKKEDVRFRVVIKKNDVFELVQDCYTRLQAKHIAKRVNDNTVEIQEGHYNKDEWIMKGQV